MASQMTEDPYCGIEWVPHAAFPDGSPAPILCELPVHGRELKHYNPELGTTWAWQDTDGS